MQSKNLGKHPLALILPVVLMVGLFVGATAHAAELSDEERDLANRLASEALADRELLEGRVFLVDTTLIRDKGPEGEERRLVLVTHYRYEGDTAILTTIDLAERAVVDIERVPHLAVPLSGEEFAEARALALEDPRVRELLSEYAERAEPEILVMRVGSREDPLFGHRVVRMMFRVGSDYLNRPVAIVDLTDRTVTIEPPSRSSERGEEAAEPPPLTARELTTEPPTVELFEPRQPLRPGTAEVEEPAGRRVRPQPAQPTTPIRPDELDLGEVASELEVDPAELRPLLRTCCPRRTASADGRTVVQEFPPQGPTETSWRVRYGHATGKGLYITGAWFKRTPQDPWMRILWDARLSDIFVPYHSGDAGLRFLDLTDFNFDLVPVTAADLGCCGTRADDFVVHEVRDRGILWKDDQEVRRGHELVLWATLDAANYNYIIEYGFRDDGTITFRLGATARNLPGRVMEAHMHDGLWRVDLDLDGFPRDSALLTRHSEPFGQLAASDHATPFSGGTEGSADWEALEFTGVRVVDQRAENGKGEAISYDLMPLRRGRPRHQEPYTHHDFWVTRYHPTELFYTQIDNYVADAEPVADTDVVLWHISGAHHLPRREDGESQGNVWKGSALVMWSGFDLRPRNLFDRTPFFPY